MKTILLLILSAFTASAATLYPVMSDSPNRTITGGATNLMLLSANNAPTGTNTLNIASLRASGAASVVLLATNLNWLGNVTGSASSPSPWTDAAQVASFTMPAVPGNNGVMRFTLLRELSNAVTAAVFPVFYGGASDGFLGASAGTGTSAVTNFNFAAIVFANNGSSTNQIVNAGGSQNASWTTASSVLDTSTNWTLRLGLSHSSGAGTTSTNIGLKTLIVEWVFGP